MRLKWYYVCIIKVSDINSYPPLAQLYSKKQETFDRSVRGSTHTTGKLFSSHYMYYLLKLQNVVIYIVAIISYHVFSPQLSSDNTYMLVARLNHVNASVCQQQRRRLISIFVYRFSVFVKNYI